MKLRPARPAAAALALAAGLGLAPAAALAGKAHEHGAARLDLAVEVAEVTLNLEMPLDSLVGFERAPRTDAERKAAAAALASLRDAASQFRFDAAAQCTVASSKVEAPVLEATGAAAAPKDGHADALASYVFKCAQPARLASLELRLFDSFRRLERVEVQAALPRGQTRTVLRRNARSIALGR